LKHTIDTPQCCCKLGLAQRAAGAPSAAKCAVSVARRRSLAACARTCRLVRSGCSSWWRRRWWVLECCRPATWTAPPSTSTTTAPRVRRRLLVPGALRACMHRMRHRQAALPALPALPSRPWAAMPLFAGIQSHFDDRERFAQPIYSLRLYSDSRLSFGTQLYGYTNGAFAIPMPRGCVTVMEVGRCGWPRQQRAMGACQPQLEGRLRSAGSTCIALLLLANRHFMPAARRPRRRAATLPTVSSTACGRWTWRGAAPGSSCAASTRRWAQRRGCAAWPRHLLGAGPCWRRPSRAGCLQPCSATPRHPSSRVGPGDGTPAAPAQHQRQVGSHVPQRHPPHGAPTSPAAARQQRQDRPGGLQGQQVGAQCHVCRLDGPCRHSAAVATCSGCTASALQPSRWRCAQVRRGGAGMRRRGGGLHPRAGGGRDAGRGCRQVRRQAWPAFGKVLQTQLALLPSLCLVHGVWLRRAGPCWLQGRGGDAGGRRRGGRVAGGAVSAAGGRELLWLL
jgi:hypothetical protein